MPEVLISYIKNICLIAFSGMLCTCICTAFSGKKGLEGAVKLCVSLCLMLSILSPAKRIFSQIDYEAFSPKSDISSEISSQNGTQDLIYLSKKKLEQDLKTTIFENFGITVQDLSIDLCEVENEFFINQISLKLKENDTSEGEKVKNYIFSLFDVPIFVN